ncbi:porin [Tepidicaulis sp. LMO-SS28]|uniref:porin n=1 Tax=Tepidicaulis sp. LMO-SS28 TaxID=3447455 RepID=UPI003EDEC526
MKKTLLGTTALVSAGLVAGPALASDPLNVTVSGSVITGVYFVDSDIDNVQETKIPVVARDLTIEASGTLDNGLVAGAVAMLELGSDDGDTADTDDATFQEVYAYLEGGFGRTEIGATDGAAFKMHYSSPWFVPGNGVDSPNIFNSRSPSARTSTYALMTEDDNKVSYFTPRIAGFQLGASYTPDTQQNEPNANGFGLMPNNIPGQINDVMEVSLNYAGEFGGLALGLDGFYGAGEGEGPAAGDPEEWGFGANVGFAGFTLGGAWYENDDISADPAVGLQNVSASGDSTEVWTAGVSYGTGPWTIGTAYLESEGDDSSAAITREVSFWQVGGGYALGAGVDLGLDIQFIEDDNGVAGGAVDSTSGGVVLAISF